MPVNTILKDCAGLNTVSDPTKLTPEDLQYALDVRVDDYKRINRVDGYASALEDLEDAHSLWCDGGECAVAQGTSLFLLGTDNTLTGVESGMSGDRIGYCQVGSAIYYGNGSEIGVIYQGAAHNWVTTTYNGVETDRYFETEIPPFHCLAYHAGRIFGAVGNTIYQSELGELGLFDVSAEFSLPTRIRMISSVKGGLFVSDETETWFLAGSSLEDFRVTLIATYPSMDQAFAPYHTGRVEGLKVGAPSPGLCALWLSTKGPCLGGPDGSMINLTNDRVIWPTPAASGAIIRRGYSLISTLDETFCGETNLKVGELSGGKATTNRSSFPFNSFCRRGDDYLALSDTGLFLLGGDTYDGAVIEGAFKTGITDYGHPANSRVRTWMLGCETQGKITITAIPDKKEMESVVATTPNNRTGQQTIVGKFSRSNEGRFWAFGFESKSDFSIDQFDVITIPLTIGRSQY